MLRVALGAQGRPQGRQLGDRLMAVRMLCANLQLLPPALHSRTDLSEEEA